ncbi:hypothetical protein AAFC00_005742 [Neodothiora populina]|uniref:Thioredoxin domain-containing protein n=1 Tax=Neodothiora populina TaxID=2781224 RepID=A0ABR3P5P9_9PEZI
MSKAVRVSSQAELNRILSSSRVVVADFYADWCGPCKAIAPFYETLASKHSKPSGVTFVKINTDEQRSITTSLSITAMPTFLVFKNAREVTRIQGADPKRLEQAVKSATADVSSFEGSGRKLGDVSASPATATASSDRVGAAAAGGSTYLGGGQVTSGAPFGAKLQSFLDALYVFLGLYFISLFSFDPYAAAEASPFNTKNSQAGRRPGWLGFGGGAGGAGPRGPPGGGRKVGALSTKSAVNVGGCGT